MAASGRRAAPPIGAASIPSTAKIPRPGRAEAAGVRVAHVHAMARAPGAIDAVCLMYTNSKMMKESMLPHTGSWTLNEFIRLPARRPPTISPRRSRPDPIFAAGADARHVRGGLRGPRHQRRSCRGDDPLHRRPRRGSPRPGPACPTSRWPRSPTAISRSSARRTGREEAKSFAREIQKNRSASSR